MRIIILFALWFLPVFATAQELERNEVDKYTKARIKETTWENLAVKFASAVGQRVKIIDGTIYLELSVSIQSAFRVDEGDNLYLLLANDESLPIPCTRGGVANYKRTQYESHWNGRYLYKLDQETITKLRAHKVKGARVGMGGEYYTFDNIKEKNANKLQRAIALVIE